MLACVRLTSAQLNRLPKSRRCLNSSATSHQISWGRIGLDILDSRVICDWLYLLLGT
jgi:hypothetical protein